MTTQQEYEARVETLTAAMVPLKERKATIEHDIQVQEARKRDWTENVGKHGMSPEAAMNANNAEEYLVTYRRYLVEINERISAQAKLIAEAQKRLDDYTEALKTAASEGLTDQAGEERAKGILALAKAKQNLATAAVVVVAIVVLVLLARWWFMKKKG